MPGARALAAMRYGSVNVVGIGIFSMMSGGGVSATITKVPNGGSKVKEPISGIPDVGDLTVQRNWRADPDDAIFAKYSQLVGSFTTTVTFQSLDANGSKVGKVRTYSGCLLQSITPRGYDVSSDQPGVLELVFSAQSVT